MNIIIKLAFAFLFSFFVAFIIAPLVIYVLKKQKARQEILSYVDFHNQKAGTPTMGGIIFILALCACSIGMFLGNFKVAGFGILFVTAFSLIGFADDFVKVLGKKNEGLTPLQKLIFQFVVASLAGLFMYKMGITKIVIPFTKISLNVSWGIIPICIFVFLATTNAVNLTDGLDGLAATTVLIFLIAISILISINQKFSGVDNEQLVNLQILAITSAGALFGFLFFNGYPAKIFMGDTGSLCLGGLVAVISLFSGNMLYIVLFGMVFVASSASVLIQVFYFKLTRKRVFLMAPLHHHFEKKGIHEVRIVIGYSIFTTIISIITLIIEYTIKL